MRIVIGLVFAVALAVAVTATARAAGGTDPVPVDRPASMDYDVGRAAIEKGHFAAAIAALKRAVEADPQNANAFNLLGYATRRSGDARGALVYYQQALAIDPKHIGAHEYIGEAYLMLGDVAQAQQHLASIELYCLFGCREHRMLSEAIAAYRKANAVK